jgi:hypothetical protein
MITIEKFDEIISAATVLERSNQKMDVIAIIDDRTYFAEIVAKEIQSKIREGDKALSINGLGITLVTDFKNIKILLQQHGINLFLVIDINLGVGKETYGLEIIKEAKKSLPQSFIVAYSTDNSHEADALEAGAKIFCEKRTSVWDNEKERIREKIFEFFCKPNHNGMVTPQTLLAEYKATVLDIIEHEEIVHLELEEQGVEKSEMFNRFFKLSRFEKIANLDVDMILSLKVYRSDITGILTSEFKVLKYEEPIINWDTINKLKPKIANRPIEKKW